MKTEHFVPQTILVIATRLIGDVLLITPLLHSLRKAYPKAKIDVLGFQNKCAMLTGNSDINNVIEIAQRPTKSQSWQLFKKIFNRYELAISTLSGDKPHIYAWFASKYRIGVVDDCSHKTLLKRLSCKQWVLLDNVNTHTILQNLKLAQCLNIAVFPEIHLPQTNSKLKIPFQKYAVVHPYPMWNYKQWTDNNWKELIKYLLEKDLKVLISGSPESQERKNCEQLAGHFPHNQVQSLAGKSQIPQLSGVLKKATCYIGPDTSITHMAAASGCPTIALYGPSNCEKWGPWPAHFTELKNPFIKKPLVDTKFWQKQNNVLIIQAKDFSCLPCYEEGCDRHTQSYSKCLQELESKRVFSAIDKLLKEKTPI